MSAFGTLVRQSKEPFEQALIVCFYDFTSFTKWAEQRPASEVFDCLDAYFEFTGGFINDQGGLFIKAIGDAGLIIFPGDTSLELSNALNAMEALQSQANTWLQSRKMDSRVVVQMALGNVACGSVGAPDDKRFDVYGNTVNQAALLKTNKFAITTEFYNHCSEETKPRFEKIGQCGWELKS